MARLALLLSLLCAGPLWAAEPVWFVVIGDTADANADTVMVDPVPVAVSEAGRTMNIRVNRAADRRNWEGVPYRSYDARVQFDCNTRRAHYVSGAFYREPLWKGSPHQVSDYTRGPVRQMLFLDMEPNPTARIVRAACGA